MEKIGEKISELKDMVYLKLTDLRLCPASLRFNPWMALCCAPLGCRSTKNRLRSTNTKLTKRAEGVVFQENDSFQAKFNRQQPKRGFVQGNEKEQS